MCRHREGCLRTPTWPFAAGVTLPLLSQSIILFQIGLSYLVLKKNLEKEQVSC